MGKQVFILELHDIQNHSWQGSLKWVNGHKQECFRSMLELMHLIDSVAMRDDRDTREGQTDTTGGAEGTA